ncbi:putative glycerophosphodiester phosphodiesterase [Lupinus albus]|uniref:glycerophosphodiester phosphodiesterase n=1 Tax=Lupinus albus TaxID=3870 RepID=A0A6A4MZY9_LUPAL|nr:putative glycerophosphodiester phosphodiesterase [Lupinus albus]
MLVYCFAHLGSNAKQIDNTLIISKYGSSGDFPACTDIAYKQAVSDGVDILDCPVQISKDGTPFCSSSIDLIDSTVVTQTNFSILAATIPEIKPTGSGIFSFSLNWDDIKSLTPSILNPSVKYNLIRNPKYRNVGSLLTLSEFLSFTKNQTSLPGVVIIIENAAYLAEKQGFGVTDSKTNYERVYKIDEAVGDAATSAVDDIKSFASSVVVNKNSVFPLNDGFLVTSTNTVSKLKSSNLSVFVETFSNEFVSQAWDFFSDATSEINSYIQGTDIDGVITDFQKTANRYRKHTSLHASCSNGGLFGLISKGYLPPAAAPLPPLSDSEVIEAPLPPVSKGVQASSPAPETNPGTQPKGNAQPKVIACFFLSSLAVLCNFSYSDLSATKRCFLLVSTSLFPLLFLD